MSENTVVCCIYCFENILNNKKYIGQAQNLRVRTNQHKRHLKNGTDHCTLLQKAWKKYGSENFIIYVVEECDIDQLNEKEVYWIKELHSHCSENGYNLSWGGDSSLRGFHHSEETKKKMSESAKNQPPRSEEYRKNLSEGHKGYVPSEETRKKLSEIGKKRKNSEETRKKISESNKGRIKSDEEKKKISESKKGKPGTFKGKKHTEESKEKIAEKRRGTKPSEETRKKMSESRKGMVYSAERNKKISDSWTDERKRKSAELAKSRVITDETRRKLSKAQIGKKKNKEQSSNYFGVNLQKQTGKWQVRITINGKRTYLGVFAEEIDAAKAYDKKCWEVYQDLAKLNFPEDYQDL
jgi:group I intron endonuclease